MLWVNARVVDGKVPTEGKGNDAEVVGLGGVFGEKGCGLSNVSFDLICVGFNAVGKCLCFGNGFSDLAVKEVGGKDDKARVGEAFGICLYGVVQTPPWMQDQNAGSFAGRGKIKFTVGLRLRHVNSFL